MSQAHSLFLQFEQPIQHTYIDHFFFSDVIYGFSDHADKCHHCVTLNKVRFVQLAKWYVLSKKTLPNFTTVFSHAIICKIKEFF